MFAWRAQLHHQICCAGHLYESLVHPGAVAGKQVGCHAEPLPELQQHAGQKTPVELLGAMVSNILP